MAEANRGAARGDPPMRRGTSRRSGRGPGARFERRPSTPPTDRLRGPDRPLGRRPAEGLKLLATELGEAHKWITPHHLETDPREGRRPEASTSSRGCATSPRGRSRAREMGACRPKRTDARKRRSTRTEIEAGPYTRRSATRTIGTGEPLAGHPDPSDRQLPRVLRGEGLQEGQGPRGKGLRRLE